MAHVADLFNRRNLFCKESSSSLLPALVVLVLILADVAGIQLQRVERIGLLAIVLGYLWYMQSEDVSSPPWVRATGENAFSRSVGVFKLKDKLKAKSQPPTIKNPLIQALANTVVGFDELPSAPMSEEKKAVEKSLLISSCRCGQWQRALQCFHRLRSKSVVPSVMEYSLVMASCNRSNEAHATIELFDLMQEDGQEPDILSYQDALRAAGMVKDSHRLSQLLVEVQEKRLEPTAAYFGILIEAFARCGLKEKSWETYEGMPESGVIPDQRVFKAISEVMDESEWREKGLAIIETMMAYNEPPSIQIQNYLLCSWKSKPPKIVIQALQNIRDQGFSLSSTAYRCIMAVHERTSPDLTLQLYKEMVEKNVKVDRVAYNAALCSCSHLAKHDQAMELFTEMLSNEFAPTGKTYGTLIRACTAGDRVHEVFTLWEAMTQQRLWPNRFAYQDVIECYVRARQPGKAMNLYREMVRTGITPCDATFHCLVRACNQRKWTSTAASLEVEFKVAKGAQAAQQKATMASVDSDDTSTQPSRHCQSDEGTDED